MDIAEISRIGVSICQETFTRIGFIFREQSIEDYGIDAIIEARTDEGYASGQLIGVQIKTGESYLSEADEDDYIYRGEIKHYNYWMNNCLPVIIVIVDPEETRRICYWQKVEKNLITKTGRMWKIKIPKGNIVRNTGDKILDIVKTQSESEKRFNTLLFSLEWMKAADTRELYLEVDEWINKTSGRGDFKLIVLDDGKDRIIYEQTYFGFGTRDYSLVIKDMFPWADISIDEDFYNSHMDQEWHNAYDAQIAEIKMLLLKQGRGEYLRDNTIYPYKNCSGEVEKYRLRLTVNEIGKAFLTLNCFLNEGRCYYLS